MTGNVGSASVNYVSGKSILQKSNRFDLIFKYTFAKQYIENRITPFSISSYLSHINAFNGFFEELPTKNGPSDFVLAFCNLIDDVLANGYRPDAEPLWVNRNGQLLGGAHRASVAAALDLEVPVVEVNRPIPWDSSFFLSRGLPVELGAWAAIEFSRITPDARILTVHSCVPTQQDQELMRLIREVGHVYFQNEFSLGPDKYVNLKYVNYRLSRNDNEWGGNASSDYAGFRRHADQSFGPHPVRNYLVVAHPSDVVAVKNKFRLTVGRKNFSVHSTDSHSETIAAAEMLFSTENIRWLMNASLGYNLEATRDAVENVLDVLNSETLDRRSIVLGGSSPLAAYGLRLARDTDYLSAFGSIPALKRRGIDSHHGSINFYTRPVEDLVFNPTNYFWFFGLKTVSPLQTLRMKASRFEVPKDVRDIELLLTIFGRETPLLRLSGTRPTPRLRALLINVAKEARHSPLNTIMHLPRRCLRWTVRRVKRRDIASSATR